jgi:glycosyltransferase involved in cell wall biosynthesis
VAAPANDDVTVVISCFNYGQYLGEAVASVKAQDGGPPRVIVVDDGSSEEATKRALEHVERDSDVELVRQSNAGVSAARNTGLQRATTPYVMVLDADDQLPANAVSRLRAALKADSRVGYAYGYIEFFGAWSATMRMPSFDPWRLMFRQIVGPTALTRREVFEATGGYDSRFHYEDWEFWVHALAAGFNGLQIHGPGLLHRKHGTSKFSNDRLNYRADFARLIAKHGSLYGNLERMARQSDLSTTERVLYRRLWGPRPWPARAETAFYSVLWRLR